MMNKKKLKYGEKEYSYDELLSTYRVVINEDATPAQIKHTLYKLSHLLYEPINMIKSLKAELIYLNFIRNRIANEEKLKLHRNDYKRQQKPGKQYKMTKDVIFTKIDTIKEIEDIDEQICEVEIRLEVWQGIIDANYRLFRICEVYNMASGIEQKLNIYHSEKGDKK